MGIFDEEEKKMAEEAGAVTRAEAQTKAEHSQVAGKVAEDLTSYMGSHPRDQSIDIDVHENRVSLRKKRQQATRLRSRVSGVMPSKWQSMGMRVVRATRVLWLVR